MDLAASLNGATSLAGEVGQFSDVRLPSLDQLEEVVRERDRLDHVLVAFVIPLARDELHRPGALERSAAQRRAVAVLLRDVRLRL